MKHYVLTLLGCLAALGAQAQQALPGDSLAADFRYLVKQLEATHPDPYTGFGGKVFFHKASFDLENRLRQSPRTQAQFQTEVDMFLAHLQDGHTSLATPPAEAGTMHLSAPCRLSVIPEGLLVTALPETRKHLLGSLVTAINGVDVEDLLEPAARILACENKYGRYNALAACNSDNRMMRRLFPRSGDSITYTLTTPQGRTEMLTLPFLPTAQVPKLALVPSWEEVPQGQLEYKYLDKEKQVMCINIDQIMARDNFEYMQACGMEGWNRQLSDYYRTMHTDMPADPTEAIRRLPSFSGVFAQMLEEMKEHHSPTLVIDLRGNGGGWTPITLPTLYQLYGKRAIGIDRSIKYYRLLSPLLLHKYGCTLDELNASSQGHWEMSDYLFNASDTATIIPEEQQEAYVKNYMTSVPGLLAAQRGEAVYTPKQVYVLTDSHTFSAAFHYAFFLWKMGATVVGTPSSQAPNTFMEQTEFVLPRTGLQGSISNAIQVLLPGQDRRAKTFYPDYMPTYADRQATGFDRQAEVLLLLKRIKETGQQPE